MKPLSEVLRLNKIPRVIGFDDAPFDKTSDDPVNLSGVVCAGARMEGMLWGELTRDGDDATDVVSRMVLGSKFHAQVHLVVLDGVAFGGLNVVDLPELAERLERPCVAVMRREPDLDAIHRALANVPNTEAKRARIARAGAIHAIDPFVFQCHGAPPDDVAATLANLTLHGHVPEALRLAHFIGSAVKTGASSNRA
jgi:hypothetical protein